MPPPDALCRSVWGVDAIWTETEILLGEICPVNRISNRSTCWGMRRERRLHHEKACFILTGAFGSRGRERTTFVVLASEYEIRLSWETPNGTLQVARHDTQRWW